MLELRDRSESGQTYLETGSGPRVQQHEQGQTHAHHDAKLKE